MIVKRSSVTELLLRRYLIVTPINSRRCYDLRNRMKKSEHRSASQDDRPLHLAKFASAKNRQEGCDQGQTVFTRRTAAETAENKLSAAEKETDEFGIPVQEMLGIICHCYAKGVFCSKDIVIFLREEPELRKTFGRKLPNEESIRRFRRRYAAQIEETLENVFRVFPGTAADGAKGNTRILKRQAADRLQEARHTDNTKGQLG